ncbi:MAG: DUF3276 family protein [Candidatus Cryptobacteroides sp.]
MFKEDFERSSQEQHNTEDVFSKPVRAGKRTYFFDVKSTKGNNDYYLTITESKRRQDREGNFIYDKHKIFLYKEDFEKFQEGLTDVLNFISDKLASLPNEPRQYNSEKSSESNSDGNFTEVSFEDL